MNNSLRMTSVAATLAAGLALVGTFGGCSGAECDPSQCLPKNVCIQGYDSYADAVAADKTKQNDKCRLECKAPEDCPFNYHCVTGGQDSTGQSVSYCAKDNVSYTPVSASSPAGSAPWAAPCDPTKGLDQNPDCDMNQQFWCYGTSNTDANAFCTQYGCTGDGDCPGGWWCATVNNSPDVRSSKRTTWGADQVFSVCLPRAYSLKQGSYCAPCNSDEDCPKNGASTQHCASADNAGGAEHVCATECQSDQNCPFDQHCVDAGLGTNVCLPRAATCKGDGNFCSPCRSDADCAPGSGYCAQADYSTEHFCTAATPTCTYSSSTGFTDTCPSLPALAKPPNTTTDGVGCSYNNQMNIPTKQCYGGNMFGLGCYTFHCAGTGGSCGQNSDCCSPKGCDTTNQVCN